MFIEDHRLDPIGPDLLSLFAAANQAKQEALFLALYGLLDRILRSLDEVIVIET